VDVEKASKYVTHAKFARQPQIVPLLVHAVARRALP